MKSIFKKIRAVSISIAMICASIFIALTLGEALVRYFFFDKGEREQGAERIWEGFKNSYTAETESSPGCTFSDQLIPHPFLSYVYGRNIPCEDHNFLINNHGFRSRYDVPYERDPNYFTVMVVGGSVAGQLAYGNGPDVAFSWLEDYLNKNLVSPNGKPFRVISGAFGAWAMPSQVIVTSLYGRFVDAVIAVDGYNEGNSSTGGGPIEAVNLYTYLYAAQSISAIRTLGMIAALKKIKRVIYATPYLRHSFLAFYTWRKLISFVPETPNQTIDILMSYSELPHDWPREKRDAWNKKSYKSYVSQLAALAKGMGIAYAHFLQPMPLIGKDLTVEEQQHGKFTSAETYKTVFIPAIQDLKREGLPVVSLVSIFEGVHETIYADHIHCKIIGNASPGYTLMSRRIGVELARLWKLKPAGIK